MRPYRLPEKITADDLSMFCWCCHDTSHDTIFFMDTGGTRAEFRSIVSEAVANAVLRRAGIESGMRAGRPVLLADDEWGALVSGGSPPRPGEVVWLFLYFEAQVDSRGGDRRGGQQEQPAGALADPQTVGDSR